MRSRLRRSSTYLVGVPILLALVVLAAVVVGPYVYIHYLEGPPPQELGFERLAESRERGSTTEPPSLDGTWRVAPGSQAGYRVDETLFGQGTTAVGRTEDVEGRFVLAGTVVQSGSFAVDLRTVSSDREARDRQFRDRIMDTARFPTTTFRLSAPLKLRGLPAEQTTIHVSALGRLTLRGLTRQVSVPLTARRNGGQLEVQGTIPVVFARFGIPNPSFGPARTEDHGTIEFLLVFARDTSPSATREALSGAPCRIRNPTIGSCPASGRQGRRTGVGSATHRRGARRHAQEGVAAATARSTATRARAMTAGSS